MNKSLSSNGLGTAVSETLSSKFTFICCQDAKIRTIKAGPSATGAKLLTIKAGPSATGAKLLTIKAGPLSAETKLPTIRADPSATGTKLLISFHSRHLFRVKHSVYAVLRCTDTRNKSRWMYLGSTLQFHIHI